MSVFLSILPNCLEKIVYRTPSAWLLLTLEFRSSMETQKWNLPRSMVNYAKKYFEEYGPDDSLKKATLCPNSVPDNLIM